MKKIIVILLIIICFFTWWKLAWLPITGDGLVYFIDKYNQPYLNNIIVNLSSFEWSAILIGEFLSRIFTVNFVLYGIVEIVFLTLTVVFFYLTVLEITKSNITSFSSSLILATSYFGNWDMYAGGIYPWFLERIPLMLLILPSFLFLHKFFTYSKKKYYIYSILLYLLAIGIAHWGVFLTPIFVFYSFIKIIEKKGYKNILNFTVTASYLLVSVFFILIQNIHSPGVGPSWSFFEFVLNPKKFGYFSDILNQLVYWSSYLPLGEILFGGFSKSPITLFVISATSLRYSSIVLSSYLIVFILVYFKLPKFRSLLLTVVFSLGAIFFMNSYFGQYHISTQPGPNRYLYIPTYLLSIFWSLFLFAFFWKNTSKRFLIGVILLFVFCALNFWYINENFNWNRNFYETRNKIWMDSVRLARSVPVNSSIILPALYSGNYEMEFLNDNFRFKSVEFLVSDVVETKNTNKEYYQLMYDEKCKCSKVRKR